MGAGMLSAVSPWAPWAPAEAGARLTRLTPRLAAQILRGAKLTATGEQGEGEFGFSVAISADGDTALIGAPGDDGLAGAVWVFVRAGSGWVQQGPKLTVTGDPDGGGGGSGSGGAGGGVEECDGESAEEGGAGCGFGRSVALSADGDTALIGAPRVERYRGAAWVFTRSGATWSQQGGPLTGAEEVGDAHFGRSVALSGNGDTALIGGGDDDSNRGAAWVFTRTGTDGAGGAWSQQGPKLTGSAEEIGGGYFGVSVALSADGSSALVGAPGDQGYLGSAWTFTRSAAQWSQQGTKLTGGPEEVGTGRFGYSVALSSDAQTALVGARSDNEGSGAAWVLTRPDADSAWSATGVKLSSAEQSAKAELGYSVALSGDGDEALVGAPRNDSFLGAAWIFARAGSSWSQQGSKLTGDGEIGAAKLGYSVALSGDGATPLIGGFRDDDKLGAAWVFAEEPASPQGSPPAPSANDNTLIAPRASATPHGGVLGLGPSAACGVSLARKRISVRRTGWAVLSLTRTGAGSCRGRVRLLVKLARAGAHPRQEPIGTATFANTAATTTSTASPHRRVTVKLPLNVIGRRLLRAAAGRLRASLQIVRSYPAPTHAATTTVHLTLSRAP